ncbi:hypothetical protein GFH48_26965 [Streptomyces fagopyri]|uniref:Uncharacterized protein n=1 Tax=Streptomyces fagopyri TaxID=2662397 RepID=A0A5Q0LH26_9ACTN|nr:hypothetical protein [Streptomyces fagopyri]QFZ76425.1 hypothetical protein GFH48_26965 [Streptomyces fagopyri]
MNDSLSSESFFQGAKKAAHRAMDDHGRPEYDEFALHAGVAVEKLAKAVLVSKNPVYIAEIRNNSADMVLHVGGHLQLDEERVRTVGASEAIKRLQKIGVLQKDSQLDLLIEMRNGAAHTSPDSVLAKGMISPLARTIETLLNDLGKPLDEFWGRWTNAVKNAVNEQEDQVFRDVQLRITQARHAFEDRFVGLPAEVKEGALKAPQPRKEEWFVKPMEIRDGDMLVLKTSGGDCPACGGQGLLTFEPVRHTATETTFTANGFGCYLCNFEVSGPDEMAALRKANTPGLMATVSVSHGPTLTPEEIKMGETQAG